ncbi:MAG: exonuclease domain-containing protein [Imperialibacter sp.]|uniref:3'-5' exonuclease family protein n=1 Tax=Imperialibacter sp. TaxID=2038411 RepID=UPI0032EF66BE
MYAIIDIETTGGNAQFSKITEIAIYVHDGSQVVDEFTTLINPECNIPPFITKLTGITNDMVEDAPRFFEVAKKIVEITEGKIFVAHNVNFDYGFVRHEFKRLGYEFKRDTLCTVKLSRKILPGKSSYSLGNLCKSLGIEIENRHRAGGDAFATVKLIEILLQTDNGTVFNKFLEAGVGIGKVNEFLTWEEISSLPENPGVYYFHNQAGEVIYIGKSKNIKSRVTQHLKKPAGLKGRELKSKAASVTFEETGNELVALLLESEEIKKVQPVYNRMQLRNSYRYGLFADLQIDGYIHFKVGKIDGKAEPFVVCSSEDESLKVLRRLVKRFQLCAHIAGLERQMTPERGCFDYSLQSCQGACVGKEESDIYNERATLAMRSWQFKHPNCFIFDKGRHTEEKTIICIENGNYKGFGYADADLLGNSPDLIRDCIQPKKPNREVNRLIYHYLETKRVEAVVEY